MKGNLIKNRDSKIYSEGRTYDNKLYTFKEANYRQLWHQLDICVKQLSRNTWKNLPSER